MSQAQLPTEDRGLETVPEENDMNPSEFAAKVHGTMQEQQNTYRKARESLNKRNKRTDIKIPTRVSKIHTKHSHYTREAIKSSRTQPRRGLRKEASLFDRLQNLDFFEWAFVIGVTGLALYILHNWISSEDFLPVDYSSIKGGVTKAVVGAPSK